MPLTALERFIRLSDSVIKFEVNFYTIREEEHHVYYFEVLNSELKMLWEKVKIAFDKCIDDLESSEDAEPEDIQVAESKFQSTLNIYARCSKLIKIKIDDLEAKSKPKVSPLSNNDSNFDNVSHNLPLPPCDTDIFNGDYLSWPTFRDLFTALYINNSRLSDIERLCYLIKRTNNEAREIVSKCPLTNAGFDIAWKSLKDMYENPRMLVNNQLKCLFSLETITEETSSSLKRLQRGINGFLTAMSIYEIPTQNWDPIIVFICIQRLPSQTVTLWEQNVKDKTALSLWKDLDKFLTERIQTLDCIRGLIGSETDRKGIERKVKTHVLNTSTSNTCILCQKQGHLLRFCRQFKRMSVSERFSTVKKFHCCINCLANSHEVNDCFSEHRCSVCNGRHHTLLHRDSHVSSPTSLDDNNSLVLRPANTTPNDQPPTLSRALEGPTTSGTIAGRQVFHTRQNYSMPLGTSSTNLPSTSLDENTSEILRTTNPTPNDQELNLTNRIVDRSTTSGTIADRQVFHTRQNHSVLLGTATVDLIHRGHRYQVRALIDPASECSLISEKLRKRFKIPTISGTTRISGVNNEFSTVSAKTCNLMIGSSYDSSFLLNTTASVLPSISGNLPSISVNADKLPNIDLADSNPFGSRPVELLLGADVYPQLILPGIRKNVLGSLLAQETVFGFILTGPVKSINSFFTRKRCIPKWNRNENCNCLGLQPYTIGNRTARN